MKISKSQVTKIVLTELDQLDPVTFITESLGHERGKLTIDCYGEAWTAYWGSMGCDFVEAFIRDASVDYLTNKLTCLLYTSPSPRDRTRSRMPSSA